MNPTAENGATLGAGSASAPGIARRLACFVYEGVLLFGVVMIAAYLYGSLTQQRHALEGKTGLQAFLFVILAIYFTWFWSHGGQTVAMKAWHIRLVDAAGRPVSQPRALLRYVASWLWFLPSLVLVYQSGLRQPGAVFGVMAIGVIGYAALAWLRPDRQFWHDALCGTRLVTWRHARPAQSAG
ncbi:RDD family protein [Aquincola sp. S2]|uniref:RDD family protein n=1 Tax=Pseudaquabacterium terrae TaxID=2732868 RepID=A0ABX2EJB1_9BURK|nr:RDD family protein [Aquabacterium terrae]NRF68649.1 RDD family protein [Aquabacterium terrae]